MNVHFSNSKNAVNDVDAYTSDCEKQSVMAKQVDLENWRGLQGKYEANVVEGIWERHIWETNMGETSEQTENKENSAGRGI